MTWRDVKLILAGSARKVDPSNAGWETTASEYGSSLDAYDWNREYGFGVVDAKAAVDSAKAWVPLAPLESYEEKSTGSASAISDAPRIGSTSTISIGDAETGIEFVEFVEVRAEFRHPSFRDLEIELSSPTANSSVTLLPHYESEEPVPLNSTVRLGASRFLGEDPTGDWTLTIADMMDNDLSGDA